VAVDRASLLGWRVWQ